MRAYLARTETFVYNQIRTLRRHHPIVVAHHRRPGTEFVLEDVHVAEEALTRPLAALERAAYRTLKVPLPPAQAVLERAIREHGTRLLHFHYLTDARFLLALKRRTGLPGVVSGYGYDVAGFPQMWGGLGARYLRPLFGSLDAFLAMSDDMRRDLLALGCPEEKVVVHYYGSDTRRFACPQRSYAHEGPITLLCCGRLEPGKGQHLVLEALRHVQRRGRTDFRVVMMGDGPLRGRLEAQVAEYGWHDRVRLLGHVPYGSAALVQEFWAADVFAHPSVTVKGLKEGIPGTLVEAMAAGLPVVATWHAGIPAAVRDGEEGVLVGEGDVDALAEAFDALLGDEHLRERLGRAAAQRAREVLDVETRTPVLERFYDRLLAGRAPDQGRSGDRVGVGTA